MKCTYMIFIVGRFASQSNINIKKAYDIKQAAIIANIKEPSYSINEYKEAMQQCFRLGKDNSHTKRPIKVVFKTGHEKVRDGLIGEA
jgi:hypothetical protein